MNTVMLSGSEKDQDTANTLISAVRSLKASTLLITEKSASLLPTNAESADFVIFDGVTPRSIQFGNGIVVLKRDVTGISECKFPQHFVGVVDPDNPQAVDLLQKQSMRAVTCGLSQKNTVTFSSLESDRAVVCLQREITSVHGEQVCPRELPVSFETPHDEYSILSAVAVVLLAGLPLPESGLKL